MNTVRVVSGEFGPERVRASPRTLKRRTDHPAPPVEARLLGPVQVRHGGELIHIGGTKQRTVLAALLLARSAGVPNARLERLLWGGVPPESAHAQIQTYICKLRKVLPAEAVVERQGSGYALIIDPHELDLSEFEHRTELGRSAMADGRTEEAAAELRTALALWRGPALADVTEYMRQAEQPRLRNSGSPHSKIASMPTSCWARRTSWYPN